MPNPGAQDSDPGTIGHASAAVSDRDVLNLLFKTAESILAALQTTNELLRQIMTASAGKGWSRDPTRLM